MINKEIVASWFKGLAGDARIELVCILLDYCLPSEIRFIGTYLESAAQKDYFAFRTYESTANNPTDLSYLYLLDDPQCRRRLCLCLALLHANNRQAASVLFGNLNEFQPSSALDGDVSAELSLLYTMAANHPAFSFHQKHVLRFKLKQLHQAATTSDLSETVSDCSTGSSSYFHDSDRENTTIEPPLKNPEIQTFTSCCDLSEEKPEIKEANITEDNRIMESPAMPINTPKIYVKELKVLNIQKRAEFRLKHESKRKDDYEYIIEVSWSDNTKEKVHRCYEEMFDFQCKLRKMYPTKVDENGQPWKLAFLPGKIRIFNKSEHKGERTPIPDISEYARLFAILPKFVRGCDHVLKFFQPHQKPRFRDRKSKSSKKDDKSKSKQEPPKQNSTKMNDSSHKHTGTSSGSLLSLKDDDKSSSKSTSEAKTATKLQENEKDKVNETGKLTTGKCGSPNEELRGIDENGNNMFSITNGDTVKPHEEVDSVKPLASSIQGKNGLVKLNSLLKTSLASVISTNVPTTLVPSLYTFPSPLHSPTTSPIESPRPSPTHSPSFHRRSSTGSLSWTYRSRVLTVQDWLKTLRLHKYTDFFGGKTFHELLNMTDKDFDKLGLTTGARKKLRVNLEMLRVRGCFTSDGLAIVDLSPDYTSSSYIPSSILPLSSMTNGYMHGYCSDTELIRRVSESDSASECGSDALSETAYNGLSLPIKPAPLNGCRLSCYNCGSLGHVGGQCMAPSMDKKTNYGFNLKYDGGSQMTSFT